MIGYINVLITIHYHFSFTGACMANALHNLSLMIKWVQKVLLFNSKKHMINMVQLSLRTRLFDIYGRSLRCQYIVAANFPTWEGWRIFRMVFKMEDFVLSGLVT